MKADRQAKILALIADYQIENQEELQERLEQAGLRVTQATISRDIRELRITKMIKEDGKQYYAVLSPKDPDYLKRYIRVLQDGYTAAEIAGNLVVIKTVIGMAMAVATAIDNLEFSEVSGCIAGDDTIFVAARSVSDANVLLKKLKDIVGCN